MLELSPYRHLKELFVNKFEEARINAGITVTELSREANISRSTIDKMQKDEPVKAELAVRACRVLSQHLGYEVTYQSLNIRVI
jgi:DNA-binding XRE family transcriptional regulator